MGSFRASGTSINAAKLSCCVVFSALDGPSTPLLKVLGVSDSMSLGNGFSGSNLALENQHVPSGVGKMSGRYIQVTGEICKKYFHVRKSLKIVELHRSFFRKRKTYTPWKCHPVNSPTMFQGFVVIPKVPDQQFLTRILGCSMTSSDRLIRYYVIILIGPLIGYTLTSPPISRQQVYHLQKKNSAMAQWKGDVTPIRTEVEKWKWK